MEKKFRFWVKFNEEMAYSENFNNLACFFNEYQENVDGGNDPVLEQWTGLYDSTTWEELSDIQRKYWLEKDLAPSQWEGHELYENDVIEMIFDDYLRESRKIISKIYFDKGRFNFDYEGQMADLGQWFLIANAKVKGNVNQHPELLK